MKSDLLEFISKQTTPLIEKIYEIRLKTISSIEEVGWKRHLLPDIEREGWVGSDIAREEREKYGFSLFARFLSLGFYRSAVLDEFNLALRAHCLPSMIAEKAKRENDSQGVKLWLRDLGRKELEIYREEAERFASLSCREMVPSAEQSLRHIEYVTSQLMPDFPVDKYLSTPRLHAFSRYVTPPWKFAILLEMGELFEATSRRMSVALHLVHEKNRNLNQRGLSVPMFSGLMLPRYRSGWGYQRYDEIEAHLRYEFIEYSLILENLEKPIKAALEDYQRHH